MKPSNEPTIFWVNKEKALVRLHRRPIGYIRRTLDGQWQAQLLEDQRTPMLAAKALAAFCSQEQVA